MLESLLKKTMNVHTSPGWFKGPSVDSQITSNILGTFRFHKGFFIVEKVSSEYYYTLKKNSSLLALMVPSKNLQNPWKVSITQKVIHSENGFLKCSSH